MVVAAVMAVCPAGAAGQRGGQAPTGSQFLLPMGSLLVPGLGQYVQGAGWAGAGFTGAAVGGYVLSAQGNPSLSTLPRASADQWAYLGAQLAFTSGALSAWDSFHRSVPSLQAQGKYEFLRSDENLGDLVTAPFDFGFLTRWTTWAHLGWTALVAGIVLGDRNDNVTYPPFHGHDAVFVGALSYQAGVGEEALFRGWLMPMLQQNLGGSFWAGNGIQALVFGAGHAPKADKFALAIGAWALYEGWVTRRNGGSIRESIFHHFWYDVAVGTVTLLRDEESAVPLPRIRLRF